VPASGYSAGTYISDLPATQQGWGPIGLAFDRSDNLYVADRQDGSVYRFQPGGGQAGDDTRLTSGPIPGQIAGLAITRDERVYLARTGAGDIVELDSATGAVLRTVVGGLHCPTGLAVDPISGDLFVSQLSCADDIVRISGFESGPGTASSYASGLCCVDGVAFGPDGTLYAVNEGQILALDGTTTASPGRARLIATVSHADGLAVPPHPAGSAPPFLVVNRTDGTVTRIDLTGPQATQSDILTGGTRGDLAAVDSHGCLYATQSTSVLVIRHSDGTCDLAPTNPGAPLAPGLTIDDVTAGSVLAFHRTCVPLKRLVIRLRQRGRVRLSVVRVYVGGRRVKLLRGVRVTARIVLTRLPAGRFTVRALGMTTNGRRLTAIRRYRNCGATVSSKRHRRRAHHHH